MEHDSKLLDSIVGEASSLLGSGKLSEAIELLDLLLSLEPENPVIINLRGVALFRTGKYLEAAEEVEKAARLDPSEPVYPFNLNFLHAYLGNEGEAEKWGGIYTETRNHYCPYGRRKYRETTESYPLSGMDEDEFGKLIALGYRRTGDTISRNVCPGCAECVQIRIPLPQFKPSRSQLRVMRKHKDTRILVLDPPEFDSKKVILFSNWAANRHRWEQRLYPEETEESFFGWKGAIEIDLFRDDLLFAAGIVDRAKRGLYASACFFDPEEAESSPGVFLILKMIETGLFLGYDYLYLGEYLEAKRNMRYKKFFRPHEILVNQAWIDSSLVTLLEDQSPLR